MSGSPWTRLGIAPTDDQAAIKRAYAAQLKAIDVDADPNAFIALREAFDRARTMKLRRQQSYSAGELVLAPLPEQPASPAPQPEPEPEAEPRPKWIEHFEAIQTLVYGDRSREDIYDEICARMARLLASPEMEQIDHAIAIETWAADLILAGIPRTNAVMASAINGFGWFARAEKWDCPPAIIAVVNRNADCEFLRAIQRSTGPTHQACRLLMDPDRRPSNHYADSVAQLLKVVHTQHPTLIAEFPRESVAAWEALIERRHASAPARIGRGFERLNARIGYWWRRLYFNEIFKILGLFLGGLLVISLVGATSGIALFWIVPALLRRGGRSGGY
ncbi:hypothetical protein OF829_05590 [Sphingomonas sp. LB-2]|uniref:hypothetical protein n=1 Tax=Sphingomonas caeni TaxID=2984949 RepID=UPI00223268C3|nr:hypothetical protein [Sphingomonas caeni]MCW3846703.1 hypothetical protein [Sphingomonas caeni]